MNTENRMFDEHAEKKAVDFSLFFFAAEGANTQAEKYKLFMDSVQYADEHDFQAVWIPERHFHSFGAPYPAPQVMGGAVAACTKRIDIRAGSVVLPLGNPVRVAEEWSVIDNLSGGRVGLSFASGWHPKDFVLAPDNYKNRRNILDQSIDTVRGLWRGDTVALIDGNGSLTDVKTYPRPLQAELPFWVTAAGNIDTFRLAGAKGANLLTYLLTHSIDELAEKIDSYRYARKENGHDPDTGRVTLMIHTFLGERSEHVKEQVRAPMMEYLRTSADLAAQVAARPGISERMEKALLGHVFERVYNEAALFGTCSDVQPMINRITGAGVNEIACLIDFGIDTESTLRSLEYINEVRLENSDGAISSATGD